MQPDLFAQDFTFGGSGSAPYLPILQNRVGELTALTNAAPEVWENMRPLIAIVGPRRPRQGEINIQIGFETVRNWIKKLGHAVHDRPFYLDVLRLTAGTSVKIGDSAPGRRTPRRRLVLEQIYQSALQHRLAFVPVYHAALMSDTYTRIVRGAAIEAGRGVGLRFPLLGTVSIDRPAELVMKMVAQLDEKAPNVDLLLDVGWVSPTAEVDLEFMHELVTELVSAGSWRSVALLGSSMPSSLSCVSENSVGRIPRLEWTLWNALRDAGTDDLIFGDYGIQHPKPPADGGPGMRANIRYTVDQSTIIARGREVMKEGNAEYRRLCRTLVKHEEFRGDGFSWGDSQIGACAYGHIAPGNQNLWRAVGTSHHLAFVTRQLQNAA